MPDTQSATSTGLDAEALLGIMAEVSSAVVGVQSDPDEAYLSFPLTPMPFRSEDLEFATISSPAQARAFAEFSDMVNRLPDLSTVWSPDRPGRLWDVYGDVLRAVLADEVLTPEQRASYDHALTVLYDVGPDGARKASARLQAYITYQKQWLEAAAAVAKARREVSEDLDALVEVRDLAELQWADLGFRQEVDDARRVVESMRAAAPSTVWSGYRRNFDPSDPTQFRSSPVDGLRFMPSPFAPSGAARPDTPWPRITLDRSQLAALASSEQVPDGLRQQLMDVSSSTSVSRVSFEYNVVEVSRAWLELSIFASRSWRFAPGEAPLYDPGTAAEAWRCPAYVSGVVLARSIAVESDDGDTSPVGPLDVMSLVHMAAWNDSEGTIDPDRLRILRHDLEAAAAPFQPMSEIVRPTVGFDIQHGTDEAGSLSLDAGTTVIFNAQVATDMGPAPDMTPQAPQGVVLVLALLCRRLRKAPDPDPALHFPGDVTPKPVKVHIVQPGESLSRIAKSEYGDPDAWHRIYDANRSVIGPDPDKIVPGQALRIPT